MAIFTEKIAKKEVEKKGKRGKEGGIDKREEWTRMRIGWEGQRTRDP